MDITSLVRLESEFLQVDVFPAGGGKLVSIFNKDLSYEFLWKNTNLNLKSYPSGTEYDPVFWGGVDELLPNDIPETVDGMSYPDHGELWTTALDIVQSDNALTLQAVLPISKLRYEKIIRLSENSPEIYTEYRITNENNIPVKFLWKLHAALNIEAGDRILSNCSKGQVVDPLYSRFKNTETFTWPMVDGTDASVIPAINGEMDFFYLDDLQDGEVAWYRPSNGYYFSYEFDKQVFPCVWLFASYGGFLEHYTAILEPCTSMPIAVNDAAAEGRAVVLEPGDSIATRVTMKACQKRLTGYNG